jgi:hypothetical protein
MVRDVRADVLTVRPDRARGTACQVTHVVLPVSLLPHWAYTVRFVRAIGIQAVVALDPEALPTRVLGDDLAHAVEALVAAAVAAGTRFHVRSVDLWSQIAVLTHGRLLAPGPAG